MENKQATGTGSSSMPLPQIMNYKTRYHVSDLFIRDLETVLGEMAYVDAKPYLDAVMNNDRIIHASVLNEYMASLGNLPYRIIAPLMRALSVKENFPKYFELLDEPVPGLPNVKRL